MSDETVMMTVRIPVRLRDRLKADAAAKSRPMTAELIERIETRSTGKNASAPEELLEQQMSLAGELSDAEKVEFLETLEPLERQRLDTLISASFTFRDSEKLMLCIQKNKNAQVSYVEAIRDKITILKRRVEKR